MVKYLDPAEHRFSLWKKHFSEQCFEVEYKIEFPFQKYTLPPNLSIYLLPTPLHTAYHLPASDAPLDGLEISCYVASQDSK